MQRRKKRIERKFRNRQGPTKKKRTGKKGRREEKGSPRNMQSNAVILSLLIDPPNRDRNGGRVSKGAKGTTLTEKKRMEDLDSWGGTRERKGTIERKEKKDSKKKTHRGGRKSP